MSLRDFMLTHIGLVSLLSRITLVWVICNYVSASTPRFTANFHLSIRAVAWKNCLLRAVCVSVGVALTSHGSIALAILAGSLTVILHCERFFVPSRYLAEGELMANLLFAMLSGFLASWTHSSLTPVLSLAISQRSVAAVLQVASIVLLATLGGRFLVQGILGKGGLLPPQGSEQNGPPGSPDTEEYDRGNIIGMVERLILLVLVAIGAYQALGLLLTAKGLFRIKDSESQENRLAEYFLMGTFASSMVAILAGVAIQNVIRLLS